MRRRLGAGGAVLVVAVASATGATAARKCATSQEVTAIQAAAVQQELMVAALTCHQTINFNAFQTSYGTELRRSDGRLKHMFRRLLGPSRGNAAYHAFKTRLANGSSIRSIHDNAGYCRETQLVFAAALAPDKPSLAEFVSGVEVHDESPVESCVIRVATGLSSLKAAPNVTPKPNPLRLAMMAPPAPAAVAPATGQVPAAGAAPDTPVPAPSAVPSDASAPVAAPATTPPSSTATPPGNAALPGATTAATGEAAPQAATQGEQQTATKTVEKSKKRHGWFSGLFN